MIFHPTKIQFVREILNTFKQTSTSMDTHAGLISRSRTSLLPPPRAPVPLGSRRRRPGRIRGGRYFRLNDGDCGGPFQGPGNCCGTNCRRLVSPKAFTEIGDEGFREDHSLCEKKSRRGLVRC